jgi:hypothetical protein
MADHFLPTDVTPDEAKAGFRLIEIPNDPQYPNRPKTTQAVIFPIDASHRLMKVLVLDRVEYSLQMCSVLKGSLEKPSWAPIPFDFDRSGAMTATMQVRQWIKTHPVTLYEARIPGEETEPGYFCF